MMFKALIYFLFSSWLTANIHIVHLLDNNQSSATMLSQKIPPTARSIELFSQIKVGMSMQQVIAICGLPDADIGSGIYIYVYNLIDGSQILISAVNKNNITAINHTLKPVKGLAGTETK